MTEHFVRADVRVFLDALAANPRPEVTAANLPAMRPLAIAGMAMLDTPLGELAVINDIVMSGPGGPIALRLFDVSANREPGPAVVFYHGGGFVNCCIDTHASMCAEISRQLDLPVISVEYRLAPEHPWPAAPDDAEAAARWIAGNGPAFDLPITGLVLCGDSAGGTLAIVAALALRDRPASVPVLLQFPIYPVTDLGGDYPSGALFGAGYGLDAADMDFYSQAYGAERGHWRATPIDADLGNMPPLLLLTAALDPLRDQGRAFAAKAIAAGVPTIYREAAGTIHGFVGFRRAIPSGQMDFIAALALVRTMSGSAR